MPKAYDLSTLDPVTAERIARARESKKREYRRKREIILARNKAWQADNPEKFRAAGEAWRSANADRKRATTARWYQENCETLKARQRKREQELSTPGVLRSVFLKSGDRDLGLTAKDIPDELLETIKLTTLIKRELKQRKQVSP